MRYYLLGISQNKQSLITTETLHFCVCCGSVHLTQVMDAISSPLTDEWVKKVWCIHSGVLLSHKNEWNSVTCRKMGRTGNHCVKRSKSNSQHQELNFLSSVNLGSRRICKQTGDHNGCGRKEEGIVKRGHRGGLKESEPQRKSHY